MTDAHRDRSPSFSEFLKCDFSMASRFLTLLDEETERFTFQTFDDDSTRVGQRRGNLAQIRHGSLENHFNWLVQMNRSGAGVFVTINETDGRGRKKSNMTRIRAVWQEDDGDGLVLPVDPHIEVASSPGKYHRYILSDGGDDWVRFDSVMDSMVTNFGSDPNAKDRSRVMRLPGFYHLKNPKAPHLVRIINESGALPLDWDQLTKFFPSQTLLSEIKSQHRRGLDVMNVVKEIHEATNYHGSLRDLAAHHIAKGLSRQETESRLEADMNGVPLKDRDSRWYARRDEIPTLVQSAIDKGYGDAFEWSDPVGFDNNEHREPYPLDALPEKMRAAVEQVVSHVQAPEAMVASSAIASLSLAAQPYINVQRDSTLIGPTSLFLMVIADSGERKSTCDKHFLAPIKDYEDQESRRRQDEVKKYAAELSSWDSKTQGVRHRITSLSKKGLSTESAEKELAELMNARPKEPLIPRLIYSDATPEALATRLAKSWPSGGVMSSEGGVVFGSHGMSTDSVMRTLAMQNELWDGGSIRYDRKTTESVTISNARLSMFIQVQSATINEFLNRSGDLFRGIGSFARFLVCYPESTQGMRPYSEPPEDWDDVTDYQYQISRILGRELPIDKSGQISPITLKLDGESKKAWVRFYNEVEQQLTDSGKYRDIRDVASKAADNCARLAALFQYLEDDQSERIYTGYVMDAARIIRWHLAESIYFLGGSASRNSNEALLDEWLLDRCRANDKNEVLMSEVMQFGPNSLRKKRALTDALEELEMMSRARLETLGRKKKVIKINPALLSAAANVAKDHNVSNFSGSSSD